MKDYCNYYNTKSLNNILQQNTPEPIYRLAALFARGAQADISARGTKRGKHPVVHVCINISIWNY
jgi:hypothetical protein